MRSEHPELAGPAKRCLGALDTVSWPWIPVLGLLEPPRRGGENAQKTGIFGEKMDDKKKGAGTGARTARLCIHCLKCSSLIMPPSPPIDEMREATESSSDFSPRAWSSSRSSFSLSSPSWFRSSWKNFSVILRPPNSPRSASHSESRNRAGVHGVVRWARTRLRVWQLGCRRCRAYQCPRSSWTSLATAGQSLPPIPSPANRC